MGAPGGGAGELDHHGAFKNRGNAEMFAALTGDNAAALKFGSGIEHSQHTAALSSYRAKTPYHFRSLTATMKRTVTRTKALTMPRRMTIATEVGGRCGYDRATFFVAMSIVMVVILIVVVVVMLIVVVVVMFITVVVVVRMAMSG